MKAAHKQLDEIEEERRDVRAYDAMKLGVREEIANGDFITLTDYLKARLSPENSPVL